MAPVGHILALPRPREIATVSRVIHALPALLNLTSQTVLHWQLYIVIFRTIKADRTVSDTMKAEQSE